MRFYKSYGRVLKGDTHIALNFGFDSGELLMLEFNFMICPPHKTYTLDIGLLGAHVSFWIA